MTTVLIVDDRASSREIARATLDHGGYEVLVAANGHQALAIAKASHPDVVLSDVLMPGLDGYDLVRQLRGDPDTAGIPVVFYTGNYQEDEALPLAATLGVSKILSKSATPAELLHAVEEALHGESDPIGDIAASFDAQHATAVNAKLVRNVEALDHSEARFAAMAEASPVGIVIGDRRGLATYVNPRLSEITKTLRAELLGDGWQQCLSHQDRQNLSTGADHHLNLGPGGARHRSQITLSDGRSCWLTVLIQNIYDSEHVVAGFVAMIDDVTAAVEADERRKAEELKRQRDAREQIRARFDSLARLAGGVAHDVNNILNVVMSFGEFIKESVTEASGTVLTEGQAQAILSDVDRIYGAGQRGAHLAHQLLAFGGRQVAIPALVNVNTLVDQARDQATSTMGHAVAITTHLDPKLRDVLVDPTQLTQVLTNLVGNARDAMPDGGQLHLRTDSIHTDTSQQIGALPVGEYVHIAVSDSGGGMSAEVAQQAMEPFYTTKPRSQGSGLGLATSYGVIKQAGGDIVIDSTPGHGTTMHVYLPTTDQRTQAEHPATTTPESAGQTILVADDEDGIREAIRRHLTRAGYHVLTAPDGRQALTMAQHHHDVIHALLTDVVMPFMNGPELAEALRHTRPDIPVLYMSGYAAPLMTEQGLLGPDVTVLGKPFTKLELLDAVNALTA